jgi:outer membrane protein OmpA-like peptidoglycan-associated protein
VKRYLIGKGVSSKRLTSEGFGDTRPVSANDTEDGRQKNRRVELKITE